MLTNLVNKNAFDVSRYINITGQISHVVSFASCRTSPGNRVGEPATGNSVTNDSLVYRVKYAYAQFNLDDWMPRGSWARLGIQQTPWIDFEEGIYRYRFEGTVFAERVPLPTSMASSDAGASYHVNFPSNFGDIHVGVYNGENYQRPEINNEKALEFRGSVRPFALGMPILRGLRAHLVYYKDHYQRHDERNRQMGNLTYEQNLRERRVRLPERRGPDARDAAGSVQPRIFGLGDAAAPLRQRLILGGAASIRPLDSEHIVGSRSSGVVAKSRDDRVQPADSEPDDCRSVLLVSARGQREHRHHV